MWKSTRDFLTPAIFVIALSAVLAWPARANDGEAVYRCRVLGDARACASLQTQDLGAACEAVPGSYARYLMYLGRSKDQAIAEASSRGESPTWRFAKRSMPRHLTGEEAHEKYLGRTPLQEPRVATDVGECAVHLAQ